MDRTHTYECMCLLDNREVRNGWQPLKDAVAGIFTKHGAQILSCRRWEERRLAYPIRGQQRGTYLLTYFKADGAALKEVVADCHLSDLVLRELILKVHPKLVDHLVHQAMTSTPNADEEGRREEDLDERPRRRRRDD